MKNILEEFNYSSLIPMYCPSCSKKGFAVSMTNKSVKLTCQSCPLKFFYRRIPLLVQD